MDYTVNTLKKEFSKVKLSPRGSERGVTPRQDVPQFQLEEHSMVMESGRKTSKTNLNTTLNMKLKEQLTSKRSLNYSSFQVHNKEDLVKCDQGRSLVVNNTKTEAQNESPVLDRYNKSTHQIKNKMRQLQAKNDIEASVNYISKHSLI